MIMKDEPVNELGVTITLANGKTCRFILDIDDADEEAVASARNYLKFLTANESLIRHMVAFSAVRLFRDNWFNSEPPEPDELAGMIKLHTVEIYDEGVELFYTAADKKDDIFAGHWLQVPINEKGELGEPEIQG